MLPRALFRVQRALTARVPNALLRIVSALGIFGPVTLQTPAFAEVDFSHDVRPILANHCLKCHGPDEASRKGGLRLDERAAALAPAESGERAIVPGQPDKSELVRRIYATDDDEMPPAAAKNPLSEEQKEILKHWIASGAEYESHWAFIKPTQTRPPKVRDAAWPRNIIDYFVLARLEKEVLQPSPRADKATLVRRVYLDLIGLPPTPEQADEFINDPAPDAYERLVDKLLASPHYGERWARRWLDLARYADTNGFEKDRPRDIWLWRDWVIKALNDDMPFDQFTIEQIAGDMLEKPTRDQIIATGFHRNTMRNEEGGIDPLEYRFYSVVDRVHVTSTAWLGLTMSCAQCHTHKYDPIPHTDYFRFFALLNNADEPTITVPQSDLAEKRADMFVQISALEAALPDAFPIETRIDWLTPGHAQFQSKEGAEAELLSDGSFRVSGKRPEKDTYTVSFQPSARTITHLQLEAIPDNEINKGGPGRTDSGNFVLSEIELEVRSSEANAPRKLKFARAEADFSQKDFYIEDAIDGKDKTGWGIAGPENPRVHRHAVFELAEPLKLEQSATLVVRLIQNHGSHHTLGRFRISVGEDQPNGLTLEERQRQHRERKFAAWVRREAAKVVDWKILRPVSAEGSTPYLTIENDDSIFANGDFTKHDTYALQFRDVPEGVKAIRLEALPDARLPNGGPGAVAYEGPTGDFFLSEFRVKSGSTNLPLHNATETFANRQDNVAKCIDGDLQSGWSIKGEQGKPHNAVFQLTNSLSTAEPLHIELVFEKYYAAGLGKFRIAVTTNENATASALSDAAQAVLRRYRSDVEISSLLYSNHTGMDRELLLHEFARFAPELNQARRRIDRLRNQLPRFPTTLVMSERPASYTRKTFRHHRGEFLQPKEKVTPGVPAILPQLPKDAPANRLTLARWLVSESNPLTARVTVNRQWEAFFGRGIVRTLEDFGYQGDLPSHPELLDWLAVEFMKQGWSLKKLHRLIVLSATYQQDSKVSPAFRERDPENILLARGPRFRLDAEQIRDTALVASGLFSDKVGGPSVYPPQPPGVSTEGAYGALKWQTNEGPDRYRRGLYTFAKRTTPYAMAATFDAPSGEACVARRERSNSPLQALSLLNDTVAIECARALGRLTAAHDGTDAQRLEFMFRRCLTRQPTDSEREKLLTFYQSQLTRLTTGELKAADLLEQKEGEQLNEHAAWTAVARVLLNLDETITKS